MQFCHSLGCKQIDMSTADRIISIFQNNAGTPLPTLRGNAATLEYNSTSCTLNSLTLCGNYSKSISAGFYLERMRHCAVIISCG